MTDPVTSLAEHYRRQCGSELDPHFHGEAWLREAFLAVPREHFVPDRVWWPQRGADGQYPLMDRTRRPRQWLKAVYRPGAPLITQIEDGAVLPEAPAGSDAFTSSISCARVVVTMLRHLGPQPGETVLEIGTGTGYSTALLCHRLGDEAVTSIEVDAGLAATAAHNLKGLGLSPRLVTGDGTYGYAARAPYDRHISTACVQRVPTTWLQQIRAVGRILTPLTTPLGTDALLTLTTDNAGGATGQLLTAVNFMLLRSQRRRQPWKELGWPRLADFHVRIDHDGQHIGVPPP
ncbi:methyltransferase domain-containing protein [Streptomyces purpurogeneiscleroticus]|uniref:methyltransferase domain-containing protein n=1 Tax=Streptomyces purpurogeneiscleroticus TaxID=68259 RepID=UPI001CBD3CF8|nr:methyltransferase domain-containing protein [Streptomyces purpurogeneiscleroticus]MBZ4018028.1 protein-L-isoaspartate(D-aspartate) O-methyltransferase [Streptomyces purpurogeneiscleroticus]